MKFIQLLCYLWQPRGPLFQGDWWRLEWLDELLGLGLFQPP